MGIFFERVGRIGRRTGYEVEQNLSRPTRRTVESVQQLEMLSAEFMADYPSGGTANAGRL